MPSRITLNANGGPEVLRLEQVQAQQPGPGEVWLEQAAIGVNPLDLGQRTGASPRHPPGRTHHPATALHR